MPSPSIKINLSDTPLSTNLYVQKLSGRAGAPPIPDTYYMLTETGDRMLTQNTNQLMVTQEAP